MQDRWEGRAGAVWIRGRQDGGVGGDPARDLGGLSVAGVAGHAFAVDVDQLGRGGMDHKHQNSTLGSRNMCSPVGLATRYFFFNLVYFWPLVFF